MHIAGFTVSPICMGRYVFLHFVFPGLTDDLHFIITGIPGRQSCRGREPGPGHWLASASQAVNSRITIVHPVNIIASASNQDGLAMTSNMRMPPSAGNPYDGNGVLPNIVRLT